MRAHFKILAVVVACAFLGACGQSDSGTSKLTFETIFDNLDPGKNTELHYKEYWKSIDHQELASSGTVVDVKDSHNAAEVTVINRSRPAHDGVNMILKVPDISRAAKLKVKDSIKFKGTLRDYHNHNSNEVVIYLEQVIIPD